MALTFYYASGSPLTWRVWFALEHKNIPYGVKVMTFSSGDLKKPEFLSINPRHKVPAIVDGDFALYESAAILEYLDEQYASGKKLFPGDVKQRALIRRLIREADAYVGDAQYRLAKQIFFTSKEEQSKEEIASARSALGEEMARFEAYLNGDYLAGELSAADFTLYPILALCLRMEKMKPDLNFRGLVTPKLAAWMKRIEALPYYAKTYPPHWKSA